MSYDPFKDPGSSPPAYLYGQQAVSSDGYQNGAMPMAQQGTGSVQQQRIPETNSTLDQRNENAFDQDEDPSSVSVAHLNVSYMQCRTNSGIS